MTDATTIAATTAVSVSAASVIAGIDMATLLGAISGASVFVLGAKDLPQLTRFIYLIISTVMGYLGGASVLGHVFNEPAISAFIFSAVAVGLVTKLIKSTDQIDVNKWLKPGG